MASLKKYKRYIMPAVVLGLIAFVYFSFFHTKVVETLAISRQIKEFNQAVATKDRGSIALFLQDYLTPDAVVTLKISLGIVTMDEASTLSAQKMTKEEFMRFIDLTVYPLTDYGMEVRLSGLSFAPDLASASVTTNSHEWARDMIGGYSVGKTDGYSSNTRCVSKVVFEEKNGKKIAVVKEAVCEVRMGIASEKKDKSLGEVLEQSRTPAAEPAP